VSTLDDTSFGRFKTCSLGQTAIPSVMDYFMLILNLKGDIRKRAHTGIRKSVKPRRFRRIVKKQLQDFPAAFFLPCFFIMGHTSLDLKMFLYLKIPF